MSGWKRINDERKSIGVYRAGDSPGYYSVGVSYGDEDALNQGENIQPIWCSVGHDTLTEAYTSLLESLVDQLRKG